ncbi:hypothetical protein DCAR_0100900 [Daucus carota subsp. sativus]|uniref:P-type ATPase A domain-containing protein n=1 Tax=Daucus carota subsp. sativus TaxID=79200 RepID=A0A166G062_DAUCS|nr:hypothetical protein DCAR_0100900 [Daucus carota subsp. sativus]
MQVSKTKLEEGKIHVYRPLHYLGLAAVALAIFPIFMKAVVALRYFNLSNINILVLITVIAETGERVNADQVQLNTILSIKPGDVIPIDGVVVQGNCDVDEKTLTGEWSHSLTPLQLMDDAIMMMISWILQMELVVHHVAMLIVQVQK